MELNVKVGAGAGVRFELPGGPPAGVDQNRPDAAVDPDTAQATLEGALVPCLGDAQAKHVAAALRRSCATGALDLTDTDAATVSKLDAPAWRALASFAARPGESLQSVDFPPGLSELSADHLQALGPPPYVQVPGFTGEAVHLKSLSMGSGGLSITFPNSNTLVDVHVPYGATVMCPKQPEAGSVAWPSHLAVKVHEYAADDLREPKRTTHAEGQPPHLHTPYGMQENSDESLRVLSKRMWDKNPNPSRKLIHTATGQQVECRQLVEKWHTVRSEHAAKSAAAAGKSEKFSYVQMNELAMKNSEVHLHADLHPQGEVAAVQLECLGRFLKDTFATMRAGETQRYTVGNRGSGAKFVHRMGLELTRKVDKKGREAFVLNFYEPVKGGSHTRYECGDIAQMEVLPRQYLFRPVLEKALFDNNDSVDGVKADAPAPRILTVARWHPANLSVPPGAGQDRLWLADGVSPGHWKMRQVMTQNAEYAGMYTAYLSTLDDKELSSDETRDQTVELVKFIIWGYPATPLREQGIGANPRAAAAAADLAITLLKRDCDHWPYFAFPSSLKPESLLNTITVLDPGGAKMVSIVEAILGSELDAERKMQMLGGGKSPTGWGTHREFLLAAMEKASAGEIITLIDLVSASSLSREQKQALLIPAAKSICTKRPELQESVSTAVERFVGAQAQPMDVDPPPTDPDPGTGEQPSKRAKTGEEKDT